MIVSLLEEPSIGVNVGAEACVESLIVGPFAAAMVWSSYLSSYPQTG